MVVNIGDTSSYWDSAANHLVIEHPDGETITLDADGVAELVAQTEFDAHDHSGEALGSTTPLTSVATEDINTTVYARSDETINDVIARTSGDVEIILPSGETAFDDSINDYDGRLAIRGQGKESSRLVAQNNRFIQDFSDHADTETILSDLTFDGNNLASGGRYFLRRGTTGCRIAFRNVAVENIDLTDHSTDSIGFVSYRGHIDEMVFDNVTYRADTFTNIQGNKYAFVRGQSSDTVGRLQSSPTSHYVGNGWTGGTPQAMVGFQCTITGHADIDGLFENWDQWATAMSIGDSSATVDIKATTKQMGDGDQFWLYSSSGGGTISYTGVAEGTANEGDRVFVLGGSDHTAADVVHLNCTVNDVYLPVELNGSRVVTGTVTARNTGHPTDTGGRMAVYIRDRDGTYHHVNLTVNILNETTDRYLDPGVGFIENNANWDDDGTFIIEGQIDGAESTAFNDGTDAGTAVDEARLFY